MKDPNNTNFTTIVIRYFFSVNLNKYKGTTTQYRNASTGPSTFVTYEYIHTQ